MSPLQSAPKTQEEVDAARPLSIPPDQVLEMDEATWYAKIYRGESVPQLTIRAVAMGSFLGFFLAFTNLYIGLKTGWGLGVAITACILSYAIWNILLKVGIAKTPMTILETNCMQSTASSAGYATGGTMVSAIAALLMLSATTDNPYGAHLPWPVLVSWTFFLAVLGTVLAIPMKRNLINHERLKFPSGTAAAVTLHSLYSEGDQAIKKARVLMWSAIFGAVFPLLLELPLKKTAEGRAPLLPADVPIFDWLPARGSHVVDGKVENFKPSDWTMVFDSNPVMIAAGAIVGLRVSIWMLLGSLALIFVVGPVAYDTEWLSPVTGANIRAATAPYKAWKEIGLWLGVPIMVSSGLLGFALQWKTIVRAFSGFRRKAGTGQDSETEALVARTEVPFSWFAIGGLLSGAGVVTTAHAYFDVPWFYGVLAVGMTFLLALVACRATGESDITPVGAMGKIMQLTYGVLIPQSMTANLMTASITASAAGSAADLLNDLKSGYLLGANPRRQFLAQFAGIFSGTAATVMGFYLLVPDASVLNGGTDGSAPKFPAPAAQAWKAVAEVFKTGLENMHPMHQQAIVAGLLIGAIVLLMETFLPKARKYLPSATGLGLGLILPFQYPFAMLIGALIAYFWTRSNEKQAEDYLVPVSAGVIAGVSIMGVLVAVLNNLVLA
ncbi:MAG: OPT family oligopeptide transporter [Myxococcota bacterium]